MIQQGIKYLSAVNFGLFILSTFLWVFSDKIALDMPFLVLGRIHPLVLHMPIGMFFIWSLISYFEYKKEITHPNLVQLGWHIIALSAMVSVITGLILSADSLSGYNVDTVFNHKIAGYILASSLYFMATWWNKINRLLKWGWIGCNILLVIFTGHSGANMTHGENFLFPTINTPVEHSVNEESTIYDGIIWPIFEQKCISCHNPSKSKGHFIMTDTLSLFIGGDNGFAITKGNLSNSFLHHVITLPLEDELHMPPKNKSQLSQKEVDLITHWIEGGASLTEKIIDIKDHHPSYLLIQNILKSNKKIVYSFPKAPSNIINSLNNASRSVLPLYQNSPALEAQYFLQSGFDAETIKDLYQINDQLVSLSLNNMPIRDEHLALILPFKNLEKLSLNFTKVSSLGLKTIGQMPALKELALVGNDIDKELEAMLKQNSQLKKIYLTQTKIDESTINIWRKTYPNVIFVNMQTDTTLLQLTPPIIVNEETILHPKDSLKLKHQIKGTTIRYTLDGTDPDSSYGVIYSKPISITEATLLKAIAHKEGWLPSQVSQFNFFIKGISPQSVKLITSPSPKYQGLGANTLTDNEKGPITNLTDPKWLGYIDTHFEADFYMSQPTALKQLVLCYGTHIGQYVFPPTDITIKAGTSIQNLSTIKHIKLPPFEVSNPQQTLNDAVIMDIPKGKYSIIKIIAQNIKKLPPWHVGRGEKGWVFIDEVFFY